MKDILAKRVASPERLDYADYLRSYRIPPERASELSLLQLLAYTGGKLTGDGFCFVPTFRSLTPPYDFVFEIAGFRHWKGMTINPITSLLDQDVSLIKEPENEQDADAIAIYYDHKKIGYVPRGLATDLGDGIMDEYHVAACVTKVNGTQERPKISVLVRVS
ncbi:MAG TPA: HIRAN domain-containing protein [Alphaproteobacteria bacterium]|nr:HIRAN domain-containing protein [Alphaproteobacteria bacterium]